jgi:hypothetical protein
VSLANVLWDNAWIDCLGDKDLTNARVGGRASKANPDKEDVKQWQIQGPKWVEEYIQWRQNNPEWKIWVTPQGAPAIELSIKVVIADVPVLVIIDRVFEVNGELVVVDLKTSSRDPESALQLGFGKLVLEEQFHQPVNFGTYFMSRKAGTLEMIDLSWYSLDKMEYLVETFDKARKTGLFLPNAGSCGMCGFTSICEFTSKRKMTQ